MPRKTQPVPTVLMRTPATAGPTIRAELKVALLRLTAFGRSSGPTSSTTNDWRTGVSRRGRDPEREGERVDLPELHGAGHVEQAESEREHAHRRPGRRPASGACRSGPRAPRPTGPKRSTGQELQRGDDAERDPAVAGQVEDQPVLRDPLRPGAGQADDLATGEQPVVADVQRAEGGAHAAASRSSTAAARVRTSRSAGSSSRSCRASQASRRRRSSSRIADPSGVDPQQHLPAVGRVRVAAGQPGGLQGRDQPGHRRRLHPLVRGQLAGGQRAVPVERREGGELAEAERGVGALGPQPAGQAHDAEPERAGEGGLGGTRHVVSLTHYPG